VPTAWFAGTVIENDSVYVPDPWSGLGISRQLDQLPPSICHLLVRQWSDPLIVALIATVIEAPGKTVTELTVMDAWAVPAIKARPARMEKTGIIRFI